MLYEYFLMSEEFAPLMWHLKFARAGHDGHEGFAQREGVIVELDAQGVPRVHWDVRDAPYEELLAACKCPAELARALDRAGVDGLERDGERDAVVSEGVEPHRGRPVGVGRGECGGRKEEKEAERKGKEEKEATLPKPKSTKTKSAKLSKLRQKQP